MKILPGAIFDLDGTLLDSMDVWHEVDVNFLKKRGIELPEDYQRIISAMETREAADYTIERFGFSERPEDLIEEWFSMVRELYHHEVQLKPFSYEYIHALHEQGIKLAVATSSDRDLFVKTLERTGIADCFDAVVTAKDVARGKRHPDIYLRAAELLGLSVEKCIVYEDILQGVRVAKGAGFATVAVHEPANSADEMLLMDEADAYIHSYEECLDWLQVS